MKARHLSFETLESRLVMDGNVAVSVVAGDLKIIGDAYSNQIDIQYDPVSNMWTVAGVAGSNTKVNGRASVTVGGVTNSVWIQMGDGHDVVNLKSFSVPNELHVDLGRGNDVLNMGLDAGTHTVKGETWLEGKDGQDSFTIADTVFAGNLWVKLGAGNDTFRMNTSRVDCYLRLDGDDGDDRVLLENLAVANLLLRFQEGNDYLCACNVRASGSFDVYMMSGDDTADIQGCSALQAYLNGGVGSDQLTLANNSFGKLKLYSWER